MSQSWQRQSSTAVKQGVEMTDQEAGKARPLSGKAAGVTGIQHVAPVDKFRPAKWSWTLNVRVSIESATHQ